MAIGDITYLTQASYVENEISKIKTDRELFDNSFETRIQLPKVAYTEAETNSINKAMKASKDHLLAIINNLGLKRGDTFTSDAYLNSVELLNYYPNLAHDTFGSIYYTDATNLIIAASTKLKNFLKNIDVLKNGFASNPEYLKLLDLIDNISVLDNKIDLLLNASSDTKNSFKEIMTDIYDLKNNSYVQQMLNTYAVIKDKADVIQTEFSETRYSDKNTGKFYKLFVTDGVLVMQEHYPYGVVLYNMLLNTNHGYLFGSYVNLLPNVVQNFDNITLIDNQKTILNSILIKKSRYTYVIDKNNISVYDKNNRTKLGVFEYSYYYYVQPIVDPDNPKWFTKKINNVDVNFVGNSHQKITATISDDESVGFISYDPSFIYVVNFDYIHSKLDAANSVVIDKTLKSISGGVNLITPFTKDDKWKDFYTAPVPTFDTFFKTFNTQENISSMEYVKEAKILFVSFENLNYIYTYKINTDSTIITIEGESEIIRTFVNSYTTDSLFRLGNSGQENYTIKNIKVDYESDLLFASIFDKLSSKSKIVSTSLKGSQKILTTQVVCSTENSLIFKNRISLNADDKILLNDSYLGKFYTTSHGSELIVTKLYNSDVSIVEYEFLIKAKVSQLGIRSSITDLYYYNQSTQNEYYEDRCILIKNTSDKLILLRQTQVDRLDPFFTPYYFFMIYDKKYDLITFNDYNILYDGETMSNEDFIKRPDISFCDPNPLINSTYNYTNKMMDYMSSRDISLTAFNWFIKPISSYIVIDYDITILNDSIKITLYYETLFKEYFGSVYYNDFNGTVPGNIYLANYEFAKKLI